MRLAQSRTTAGLTVPVVARGDHWLDLSPLAADLTPESLSPGSLDRIRAAINTGTPAGVALGRPDKPYLRDGDVVKLEIDGLGRQRQTFRAA